MIKATLQRINQDFDGTIGVFKIPPFTCFSIELPWKYNNQDISCIPAGTYLCEIDDSPRFRRVYHVRDVPFRTDVLLHPGNWAGDEAQGKKSNVEGCIMLGEGIVKDDNGQKMLWHSTASFTRLYEFLNDKPFELTIID